MYNKYNTVSIKQTFLKLHTYIIYLYDSYRLNSYRATYATTFFHFSSLRVFQSVQVTTYVYNSSGMQKLREILHLLLRDKNNTQSIIAFKKFYIWKVVPFHQTDGNIKEVNEVSKKSIVTAKYKFLLLNLAKDTKDKGQSKAQQNGTNSNKYILICDQLQIILTIIYCMTSIILPNATALFCV